MEFARRRLQFAEMLYYKILEDIIQQEVIRLTAKYKQVDLSVSVGVSLFWTWAHFQDVTYLRSNGIKE